MVKKAYVFATGGLGNQLFQVAAAAGSDSQELIIVPNQSNARKSNSGKLDIEDFYFDDRIIVNRSIKLWRISQKGINYTLRSFARLNSEQPLRALNRVVLLATSILLTLNLRSRVQVVANRGLGFDPMVLEPGIRNFYIGYFQSSQFLALPKVKKSMLGMRLKNEISTLEEFRVLSEKETPLVVHVRIGDYQDSNSFGVLPKSYYDAAIVQLWGLEIYKKIWLFSDEPDKAIKQIPGNLLEHVRVIPHFDNSTPITFEVMRLGRGYVIANSSFSWWAASLSHNPMAKIAAPDIWFKGSGSPDQIHHPDWIKFNAWK